MKTIMMGDQLDTPHMFEHDESAPIFDFAVTWRDWEFGPGFFVGHTFTNNFTGTITKVPWALNFYFGPLSLSINLGKTKLLGKDKTHVTSDTHFGGGI